MHIHFLDPYRARSSPVHRLDPRVKFVLTIAFIFATALSPMAAWPAYILLFSLILSVEIMSALGIRYVYKRAALAVPFVLAALPVIFTTHGKTLFTLSILSGELVGTWEGLERFVSIALKSWLSVQAAIVLAASTPFPELLVAMRAVRIPRLLVALFGLMWRYLFVLADEALRLIRARAARSGQSDVPGARKGGSVAWRARVTGGMAGNLFLRGFERSDRIYMAMISRGYDGEVRSLPLPRVNAASWIVLTGGVAILGILLVMGFLF
jgi:cobalt/nickel transport system permease protein